MTIAQFLACVFLALRSTCITLKIDRKEFKSIFKMNLKGYFKDYIEDQKDLDSLKTFLSQF